MKYGIIRNHGFDTITMQENIGGRKASYDEAFECLEDLRNLSGEEYEIYLDKIKERGDVPVM